MNCPNCGAKNIPMTRRGRPYCGKCNSLFPSLQDKYGSSKNKHCESSTQPWETLLYLAVLGIIITICLN